jgi:hypothetical protein
VLISVYLRRALAPTLRVLNRVDKSTTSFNISTRFKFEVQFYLTFSSASQLSWQLGVALAVDASRFE